jgi:hypothetical protein
MSNEMYKVVTKSGITEVGKLLSDLNWDWPNKYSGILLLDVDGTIRNGKHRLSLLPTPEEVEAAGDKPNIAFTKFNEMCHLDTPMYAVINVANMFKSQGYYTIILTSCTHSTHTLDTLLRQLGRWNVQYDAAVMRGECNQLHPVEFKEQFLYASGIVEYNGNVIALDDCTNNCNLFREYDILALQVEDYSRFNKGDTE